MDFASAGPADEGIDGVEAYRVETHDHLDGTIDYGLRPPPGGAHSHTWANCGFYDQPIDDEHVVLDSVDDPRLEEFVIAYQDGSQAPEAGVTCTGTDVGDPIP